MNVFNKDGWRSLIDLRQKSGMVGKTLCACLPSFFTHIYRFLKPKLFNQRETVKEAADTPQITLYLVYSLNFTKLNVDDFTTRLIKYDGGAAAPCIFGQKK